MDKEALKSWKFKALVTVGLLLLVSAFIISIVMSCSTVKGFLNNYPDDNIIEELAEGVLDNQTGIDLDFTPWSPETH